MGDRKQLHGLVDSLPEDALDSAEKYLQALQAYTKREYPASVERFREKREQIRKELEDKRDKFLKGHSGSGTEGWLIDRNNKTHAACAYTEHSFETGEMTIRTFRVHHDFPMEIKERFRMQDDDKTLEYDFHISGLGKEHGFVLQFKANGD